MKYFCFCVPVRLGVIITSLITIIENVGGLIGISMCSAEDIANMADDLKDKSKESSYEVSSKELYEILSENIKDCKPKFITAGCPLNFIHSKNRCCPIPIWIYCIIFRMYCSLRHKYFCGNRQESVPHNSLHNTPSG